MLVYLDASIFEVWLEQDQNDPRLKGTEAIISALDSNDSPYHFIMSAITLAGVLKEERYAEAFGKFEKMIDRHEIIPVNRKIAILARAIRQQFCQQFNVETPDAIHVATALLAPADYLLTNNDKILKLKGKTRFAEFSKKYYKKHPGKQLKIIKPPLSGL